MLGEPIAAKIQLDGPQIHVAPYDGSKTGITVSSIADRMKHYPIMVAFERELTEADRRDLRYLNDPFAFGSLPRTSREHSPTEVIFSNKR